MSDITRKRTEVTAGWRDQNMRLHFRHGDHVQADSVGTVLERGGYCLVCVDKLPEPATDEQWQACYVPAAEWTQVKPEGGAPDA
jgi:hypothetical protein